jgi:hypothetical protein
MCPCTMLPVGSARAEHVCAFRLHKQRMLRARGRPWCGHQVGVSGLLFRRFLSHQSTPSLSHARTVPPSGRTCHSRQRLARLLATLQTSLSVTEMHRKYCIWDVPMCKRCMPQTAAGGSGSGYREMRAPQSPRKNLARDTPNFSMYTSHDGLSSHDGLVGGLPECDFVMELKIPRFGTLSGDYIYSRGTIYTYMHACTREFTADVQASSIWRRVSMRVYAGWQCRTLTGRLHSLPQWWRRCSRTCASMRRPSRRTHPASRLRVLGVRVLCCAPTLVHVQT